MNELLTPILLVMVGLLVGIILKAFADKIKIPYTVALFAIGILIGVAYNFELFLDFGFLKSGVDMVTNMDPDFVIYVFLPILIFDAAYEMDLHVFKKTLLNASILAGPGVVICMLLTAALVMLISYGFGDYSDNNWVYALMFGGLISATDPVAVVALLQELKTSKRFSTLVDGESLLNDGTGIVCFMLFYSQFIGGMIERPVMFFIWVVAASCVIGYIMATITIKFITKVCLQEIVQNCVVIVAAYITFILAQSTLSVSGVIALVVFGHFFAQNGRPHLKKGVNEFMEKFWSFMANIANTLIFLIVGIIIATKVDITWISILSVVLVYLGVNIIRFIMITFLFPFLKMNGYGLTVKEGIVLGWGGLRGALGMSMALMVSCNTNIPEQIRDVILLYTAGIVTLTLCINATTSKALVNKFKMTKQTSSTERKILQRVTGRIRRCDIETLENMKSDHQYVGVDWARVEDKIIKEISLDLCDQQAKIDPEEMLAYIRNDVLIYEKQIAENLYNEGIITYDCFRKISIFVSELLDFEGKQPLDKPNLKHIKGKFSLFGSKKKRIRLAFDICRAVVLVQQKCKSFVSRLSQTSLIVENSLQGVTEQINAEIDEIILYADNILLQIKNSQPQHNEYIETLTDRAIRDMLAQERRDVKKLYNEGLVSGDELEKILSDIDRRQGIEIFN